MTEHTNSTLISVIDGLFNELREEARGGKVAEEGQPADTGQPALTYRDRLDLLKAGTLWLATRNKIEIEDEPDDFARKAARLRRGAGGGGRRVAQAASNGSPPANGSGHSPSAG